MWTHIATIAKRSQDHARKIAADRQAVRRMPLAASAQPVHTTLGDVQDRFRRAALGNKEYYCKPAAEIFQMYIGKCWVDRFIERHHTHLAS